MKKTSRQKMRVDVQFNHPIHSLPPQLLPSLSLSVEVLCNRALGIVIRKLQVLAKTKDKNKRTERDSVCGHLSPLPHIKVEPLVRRFFDQSDVSQTFLKIAMNFWTIPDPGVCLMQITGKPNGMYLIH